MAAPVLGVTLLLQLLALHGGSRASFSFPFSNMPSKVSFPLKRKRKKHKYKQGNNKGTQKGLKESNVNYTRRELGPTSWGCAWGSRAYRHDHQQGRQVLAQDGLATPTNYNTMVTIAEVDKDLLMGAIL